MVVLREERDFDQIPNERSKSPKFPAPLAALVNTKESLNSRPPLFCSKIRSPWSFVGVFVSSDGGDRDDQASFWVELVHDEHTPATMETRDHHRTFNSKIENHLVSQSKSDDGILCWIASICSAEECTVFQNIFKCSSPPDDAVRAHPDQLLP